MTYGRTISCLFALLASEIPTWGVQVIQALKTLYGQACAQIWAFAAPFRKQRALTSIRSLAVTVTDANGQFSHAAFTAPEDIVLEWLSFISKPSYLVGSSGNLEHIVAITSASGTTTAGDPTELCKFSQGFYTNAALGAGNIGPMFGINEQRILGVRINRGQILYVNVNNAGLTSQTAVTFGFRRV